MSPLVLFQTHSFLNLLKTQRAVSRTSRKGRQSKQTKAIEPSSGSVAAAPWLSLRDVVKEASSISPEARTNSRCLIQSGTATWSSIGTLQGGPVNRSAVACDLRNEPGGPLDDEVLVVIQGRDVIGLFEPQDPCVSRTNALHDQRAVRGRQHMVLAGLDDQGRTYDPAGKVVAPISVFASRMHLTGTSE